VASDSEKLDKIIDLLTQLVNATTNPSNIVVQERPWSFRLLQELATGEDQDDNGMVYGHDFVFNHVTEWHPPALQASASNLKKSFKGKSISFLDYAKSLKPTDEKKGAILDYIEKKQQLNG
jgi:hypothetical protein